MRVRVEARLAARPAVGGYRDGVDAPLSAGLERVAKQVGARWIPFVRRPNVIDALLLEPAIRPTSSARCTNLEWGASRHRASAAGGGDVAEGKEEGGWLWTRG